MDKPHTIISPLHHRGAQHIKVELPNEAGAKSLIRTIPGRKWSKTHNCWYVPKTPESYRHLKEMFEVSIPDKFLKKPDTSAPPLPPKQSPYTDEPIRIEQENSYRMKAFVPAHRKDWIEQIKTIPGRAWNQEGRYWSLPMVKTTVQHLYEWFGEKALFNFEPSTDLPQSYTPKNWKEPAPKTMTDNPELPHQKEPSAPAAQTIKKIQPVFQTTLVESVEKKTVIGQHLIVLQLDANWLAAYLPYQQKEWLEKIKAIRGRTWEHEHKYWKLPYSKESLRLLHIIAGDHLCLNFQPDNNIPERAFVAPAYKKDRQMQNTLFGQLNPKQKKAVSALEKQLTLERKSFHTIKGYRNHFIQFISHFKDTLPSQISDQQIRDYVYKRITEDKIAKNTQNQLYSSLTAFYERVLEKPAKMRLVQRPHKDKALPKILTKKEVKKLLNATNNLKHKCILAIMYGSGLRVGEVVKLRLTDVDIEEKYVLVENGKGNKDRYTLLSNRYIGLLQEYIKLWKPAFWLFEGENGEPYSVRSIQQIFRKSMANAQIEKRLGTHALRHSFATHLIEAGTDLDFVRKTMGHSSIKTTQVYLHVSKKRLRDALSPLDDIDL